MEACIICKESTTGDQLSVLTEKGCTSINLASRKRGESDIASPGDFVHRKCRQKFTHPKYIEQSIQLDKTNDTKKVLRSSETFSFQDHCIFCGLPAKYIKRKRGLDVHPVRTIEFQKKLFEICEKRNDDWGHVVKGRISCVNDLHAADALYHQSCSVNFRTGKNLPIAFSPIPAKLKRTSGRPCQNQQEEAFSKTCAYFASNDNEQITILDLTKKMAEFCDEPYTCRYMKEKLKKHFGTDILITEINGLPNVVTFCYSAKSILYDFYKRPKTSSDKEAIIKAAAKLILSDIKAIQCSTAFYPSPSEIESIASQTSYVPESLKLLLSNIFLQSCKNDVKIASIGQAIMQASRPRALLAPLQISLGVQLHQQFASRFLLDTLNSLGFSASYSEVKRYQSNAAVEQEQTQFELKDESFLQFIADNVDHNSCTIDGHGTFHGMGIIGSFTPGSKFNREIPRREVIKESVLEAGSVEVLYYQRPQTKEKYFTKLREIDVDDKFWYADLLCSIIWPLRTPRPSWSGFMQMFRNGQYPGQSTTIFFPMIDLPPSDMTCIYSTLQFVCKEASKYKRTPVITFDQPLYWKAHQIISNELEDSVLKTMILRLGGFHLEMSFLGAIGHLMSGSGLHEVFETVFAPNTVGHMISGKAVSRAIRGHNLVYSALNAILLARTFDLDLDSVIGDRINQFLSTSEDTNVSESLEALSDPPNRIYSESEFLPQNSDPVLEKACSMYDSLKDRELTLVDMSGNEIFENISSRIEQEKASLENKRTARLWLHYLNMIHLLHKFLEAERTGNWKLHQKTISLMLPYLAAAGHNLYLKSAYVYLCEMQQLECRHPDIHAMFEAGHHVIRRSDRYWAGLSSDVVIEQVLMRAMKTSGGLTRGRGMTEFQRVQWLFSSPACAEMNYAMQTLTGIDYHTSDQHKESGKARQARDDNDAFKVLKHIIERNPFDGNEGLRSIETGIIADEKVNVDICKEIGLKIVNSLPGESLSGYSFKRSKQAVTLNSKLAVKVDDTEMHVDPQLLFQRLITFSRIVYPDISVLFSYELSTHPSSLFDSGGLPRIAQKSTLASAVWTMGDCSASTSNSTREFEYVLDGGSLIYKLPWEQKTSFGQIIDCCSNYVIKKFGHATIVFDGYPDGPSTKDITHLRRSKGIVGRSVALSKLSTLNSKKEVFLSNQENKKQFVNLLGASLERKGCNVLYAPADADVLIVKTAIDKSVAASVAVIGEDTDLLVLLIHMYDPQCANDVIFYSDRHHKDHKIWSIRKTSLLLKGEVCQILPLIHAITGCDTTSRIFGLGKLQTLRKFINTPSLHTSASVFFCDETSLNKESISLAGESIICDLFSGTKNESLDQLRYRKFVTKTMSRHSSVQVHELPPTSAANHFHSLRTYHQVQAWTGRTLDPKQYGWEIDRGKLVPIKTNLSAAPDDLLSIIRCKCKTGCDTKRCTCRRHGVSCSVGCGECRGINCENCENADVCIGDNESE